MSGGQEQNQIEIAVENGSRLSELTAQYLRSEIPLEEYETLADKEGPHINLRAFAASMLRHECRIRWVSFIDQGKAFIKPILDLFINS